jgi:hypothetical protein
MLMWPCGPFQTYRKDMTRLQIQNNKVELSAKIENIARKQSCNKI